MVPNNAAAPVPLKILPRGDAHGPQAEAGPGEAVGGVVRRRPRAPRARHRAREEWRDRVRQLRLVRLHRARIGQLRREHLRLDVLHRMSGWDVVGVGWRQLHAPVRERLPGRNLLTEAASHGEPRPRSLPGAGPRPFRAGRCAPVRGKTPGSSSPALATGGRGDDYGAFINPGPMEYEYIDTPE